MAKGDSRIVQLIIGAKDETAKAFSNVTRGFTSLGKLAGGIAASVGAAFTTVFSARTFAGAINSAADFETQLAKIQAVTRASPAEFNALKAAAEEMGATTKFTATQAAEALEVLARSGLSAQDSITALPTVLQLATAEGLNLAESATAITNTISQFGLAIEDASRVADVLVSTSQRSNTNVRELGEAFKFAGTVAANFGLSVEQTAGYLGILANAGIRAEQAGTGLRSIILSLATDGSALDRELDKLGITSRDVGDVIGGLADAGSGADKALQAFEKTTQPQIRTLVAYSEAAKALGIELEDVEGATAAAAEVTGKTFQGAVARLQSAWDALRRTLVEPLLGPIAREFDALATSIGDFVTGGRLESFRKALLDAFKTGAEAVRRFLTEVNPQALLDKLGSMVTGVTGFVTNVVTSFGTIERVAQGTVAAITAVFSGLQTFVGGVVSVITLPLRAIGTAIETAVGALRALGLISDETANRVDNMARVLIDLNDNAITETANAAGRTKDAMGALGTAITGTVEPARKAREQLGGIATEAEKIPTPVEAARQALEDLKAEGAGLAEIEAAQRTLTIALLEGAERALDAEDAYTRAKDRLAELTEKSTDVDELAAATERVEKAQQRFTDALTQTSEAALTAARNLRKSNDAEKIKLEQIERTKAAAEALGVSYNQAANEATEAVGIMVGQLKILAEAGNFSSGQIREAFSKALDTAESRKDIDLLKTTLQSLAEQGKISGADLTAALQGVKDKLTEVEDTAVRSIGGITAAFDGSVESVNAVADALAKAREESEKTAKSAKETGDAVKEAADAQRDAGDAAEESGRQAGGGLLGWQLLNEAQQEYAREALGLGGIVIQQGNAFDETATRLTRLAEQYEQAYFGVGDYAEVLRRAARENRALADAQRAAGDETVSYRIRLAELRGEEEEVLRLRQQQITAQLELELLQAQTEGDLERVRQLQDVIKLQAEVAEEEKKQWKERQQEREREGTALGDQEKTHGRIGSQLNKQIGQRREIAYLEEQVASRADTTAKALDRQATAGESAQRAIQSLGSADIGQLQRSIDALVQALQEGIGRGAQQARADIQALDAVDLRNLRGELAGLTEALTTDLAAGVRAAVGEMGKLNSTLLSDLRREMSALGRDLADTISDAQRQATSRENLDRAVRQANLTPNVSIQPGELAADTTAATQKIDELRRAIQSLAHPSNADPSNFEHMERLIDQTIGRAEILFRLLEEGSEASFEALGQSFRFTAGEADSFSAFVEQINQALADATRTPSGSGLQALLAPVSAPSAATTPTAADIGTAVAGALAGAPLVIQIDGEALTGSIVQRLRRDAGRAN